MRESVTFCGRTFRGDELVLMRQVAGECSGLGVTEIARTLCELLDWKRPIGKLKNHESLQRYHYLGCPVPFGANLRYGVRHDGRELACLLWTSPAWRMQARDAWIGWSDNERRRNLQAIVNQGRFLILPWVRVKGLASKILALSARQLPDDWEKHYALRPLLLETLVDAARFRGTCYRAANWIYVGHTSGRGRMDRENKAQDQAVKNIYVYPLVRDVRQRLRSDLMR